MALYDFRHIPQAATLVDAGTIQETQPVVDAGVVGLTPVAKRPRMYNQHNVNTPEELVTTLLPALHHVDLGIKNYFSDVVVPVDGGLRTATVTVRIAGGEKATLIWKQQIRDGLRNGMIKLPVIAVNRESFEFNPQKFSPAYMPIARRFVDSAGSRMELTYRPYPVLINYTIGMWAERKRDIEYMLFQIIPRFNGGLAEIQVDATTITGTVPMKMNSCTDNSDKEAEADSTLKVQYDISITAEGWIPLPQKLLPTVLGHAVDFREYTTGEFLEVCNLGPSSALIGESDPSPA